MPDNPPTTTKHTSPRRGHSDAVERLYVYWIVSTVLLLFGVVVTALYTRGALNAQMEQSSEVLNRLAALERTVEQLPAAPALPPPDADAKPRVSDAAPPAPPGEQTPAPAPTAAGPETPAAEPSPPPSKIEAPAAVPSEADIQSGLDAALTPGTALPLAIADLAAAEGVLDTALAHLGRAAWSGQTWARLAAMARLMSRHTTADAFARQAHNAGDPLVSYAEISGQVLLTQGRAQEALQHARHFAAQTDGAAQARLLLARVLLELDDQAGADDLVSSIDDFEALELQEKLALARACVRLHHWQRLADVMSAAPPPPEDLAAEHSFLHAVALIQANERLPEALAMLDYLAAHVGGATTAGETRVPAALPQPMPDEPEIATWRGVALMRGRQLDTARAALETAAALRADRPEPHYWRGMLEMDADRLEIAAMFFENALAASPQYAPAWEALGGVALRSGNTNGALEAARRAIEANDRRASAHFLLAIAYALGDRREQAAVALQNTFALEPDYLEEAQQADIFVRLFTPEELAELAALPPEVDQP